MRIIKEVSKTKFICDKCSKVITYGNDDEFSRNFDFKSNECWSINLGRAGYGSKLDGCYVDFDVCDDCLHDFVSSFNHANSIFNSGSNECYGYYEEDEDN